MRISNFLQFSFLHHIIFHYLIVTLLSLFNNSPIQSFAFANNSHFNSLAVSCDMATAIVCR